MCRLIWGFAGRTYHIVGNITSRHIYQSFPFSQAILVCIFHAVPVYYANALRAVVDSCLLRAVVHNFFIACCCSQLLSSRSALFLWLPCCFSDVVFLIICLGNSNSIRWENVSNGKSFNLVPIVSTRDSSDFWHDTSLEIARHAKGVSPLPFFFHGNWVYIITTWFILKLDMVL